MEKITKAGVYDGVGNRDYHGQLTPAPSISVSMAIKLIDGCPKKLWHGCYLNPDFEREEKTEFALGSAAHLALLEPSLWGDHIVVVNFDNYKKDAAQEARDAAYAAGKIPLLPKHVDQVMGLRAEVLADEVAGPAFTGGHFEQTVVCRDRKTGVWLKCRPDKRADDWSWIADLKTTTNANPLVLGTKAYNDNWAMRAEWYFDVVESAVGIRPSTFYFIVAEVKQPHCVTVGRFKERLGDKPEALSWGAMKNRKAIDTFAACLAANKWPSYTNRVVELEFPTWAEYRLQERCDAGDFAANKVALARAAEFHAPLGVD